MNLSRWLLPGGALLMADGKHLRRRVESILAPVSPRRPGLSLALIGLLVGAGATATLRSRAEPPADLPGNRLPNGVTIELIGMQTSVRQPARSPGWRRAPWRSPITGESRPVAEAIDCPTLYSDAADAQAGHTILLWRARDIRPDAVGSFWLGSSGMGWQIGRRPVFATISASGQPLRTRIAVGSDPWQPLAGDVGSDSYWSLSADPRQPGRPLALAVGAVEHGKDGRLTLRFSELSTGWQVRAVGHFADGQRIVSPFVCYASTGNASVEDYFAFPPQPHRPPIVAVSLEARPVFTMHAIDTKEAKRPSDQAAWHTLASLSDLSRPTTSAIYESGKRVGSIVLQPQAGDRVDITLTEESPATSLRFRLIHQSGHLLKTVRGQDVIFSALDSVRRQRQHFDVDIAGARGIAVQARPRPSRSPEGARQ